MMHALQLLQDSQFASWLAQSAYPIVITLHSLGMALLVGLLTLICLRVLGAAPGLPIHSLRRFMRIIWLGFCINAASGTLLFAISPVKFLHNGLFISKLCFIAAGLISGTMVSSMVLKPGDEYDIVAADPPLRAKSLALFSICFWLGAIITGRLLAYSTFSDIGVGGTH
jgi:hypothetical protein